MSDNHPEHRDKHIERMLVQITDALPTLMTMVNKMAGELDALKTAVARVKTVEDSAIALLQGIKAKLDAAIAADDPAALQALSDSLGQDSDALSAAVVANTPAA